MSDYSRLLIIANETVKPLKSTFYLMEFRFSIKLYNGNKFYLSNFILKQILDSEAICKYLVKEIDSFILDNYNDMAEKNKQSLCLEEIPDIKIRPLGKYFYIDIGYYKNFDMKSLNKYIRKYLKSYFNN